MPENASQNHLDIDSSFPTPLLPHTHIELTNFWDTSDNLNRVFHEQQGIKLLEVMKFPEQPWIHHIVIIKHSKFEMSFDF